MARLSKGEETRQRIIAAAAPLFNKQGYAACALKDIMDATGLEKGGIYRHFESKEEIAAEAFDYAWAVSSALRRQGLDEISDPVEQLKSHIAAFAHRSSIPGGCPLLNTGVDAENNNPILQERVQRALRGWRKTIERIVTEGVASGVIRAEANGERISRLIIATIEGAMLVSRIEKNDQAIRDAIDHLNFYLEDRVRRKKPVRRANAKS